MSTAKCTKSKDLSDNVYCVIVACVRVRRLDGKTGTSSVEALNVDFWSVVRVASQASRI